jgi:serine phosphatase RsbU (regulator of sigma subunit)
VVGLIKDGVRDGVAARAVSDYLYSYRGGKVSATLTILSVDLATQTLVLLSNSHCPVLLSSPGGEIALVPETPANPIGVYAATRPMMSELPLQENVWAVAYSDGLMEAGRRDGRLIDLPTLLAVCLAKHAISARQVADYLLARALDLDTNRPSDDMTVSVVAILPKPDAKENKVVPLIRRMEVRVPVA